MEEEVSEEEEEEEEVSEEEEVDLEAEEAVAAAVRWNMNDLFVGKYGLSIQRVT